MKAIQDFPKPTTAKKLRQFYGASIFYRRLILQAAQHQWPLNDLLRDNSKGKALIVWTAEANAAIEASKTGLAKAALFDYPQANAPMHQTTQLEQSCSKNVMVIGNYFREKLQCIRS